MLFVSMGLPVVTYRLAGLLLPVAVHGVAMGLQPIAVQPAHKADRILGGRWGPASGQSWASFTWALMHPRAAL